MRHCALWSAVMLVSVIAWTHPPRGAGGQATSLGDLARQLQTDRAPAGKKAVKVFTNDNLAPRASGEGLTTASEISSTPVKPATGVGQDTPKPRVTTRNSSVRDVTVTVAASGETRIRISVDGPS